MKVLLINDNPVVGKLVTLSAQKTGDELLQVDNIDELESAEYNLLMVDDALYSDEMYEELNSKVTFLNSCFIGSRNSVKPESFTMEINKPFLPTDLVDIFLENATVAEDEPEILEDLDSLDDLENIRRRYS